MTYRDSLFRLRGRGLYDADTMAHPPGGGLSPWERSQLGASGNLWRDPRPAVGEWRTEAHGPEELSRTYGWEYRGGVGLGRGVRRPDQFPEEGVGIEEGRPALVERRARGRLRESEWDFAGEGGWGGGAGLRRASGEFRDYGRPESRRREWGGGREGWRGRGRRGGRARYDMHGEVWRPGARPHKVEGYEGEYRPGTMWREEDIWESLARMERRGRRHRRRGGDGWGSRASPFS